MPVPCFVVAYGVLVACHGHTAKVERIPLPRPRPPMADSAPVPAPPVQKLQDRLE